MENTTKMKRTYIDLMPTLNRAVVLSAFISGKPIIFSVRYDKKSTALKFQIDTNQSLINNNIVNVNMFRNLENNCKFTQMFFEMDTLQNRKCDYRGKFIGVRQNMNRHLIPFLKEKYDFQVNEDRSKTQNYMSIWGWKLQDSDNDLLFFYVQRKCFNDVSRLDIVRTAGIQFSNQRGRDIFERYYIEEKDQIRKANSEDDIPLFFEDD